MDPTTLQRFDSAIVVEDEEQKKKPEAKNTQEKTEPTPDAHHAASAPAPDPVVEVHTQPPAESAPAPQTGDILSPEVSAATPHAQDTAASVPHSQAQPDAQIEQQATQDALSHTSAITHDEAASTATASHTAIVADSATSEDRATQVASEAADRQPTVEDETSPSVIVSGDAAPAEHHANHVDETTTDAAPSRSSSLAVPAATAKARTSHRPSSIYEALGDRAPAPVEHLPPKSQDPAIGSHAKDGTPAASSTIDASDAPTSDYDANEAMDREALRQAGRGAIDVDDAASDLGYESDMASNASTSLASSVRDYSFENGRRYHKFREGRYNFPNDDAEQDREDLKHAMMKLLCQKLYFAPIGNNPHEILDVGTGTGLWAMEMGDDFPSANVLGVDLSPIQPDWVPSNVRFMVDDVESPWLWPRNHFDYIHTRHVVQGIKDWPKFFRRAHEHVRPGGWVECQEIYHYPISSNHTLTEDHPIAQFWALVNQGLNVRGLDFLGNAANTVIPDRMREAGFVNITHRVLHVPMGTWPKNEVMKKVGLYWRTVLYEGTNAIAMAPLTRGCGWTREEVERFLVDVRRAYYDNAPLMYFPLNIVYGQKAETAL